MKHNTVLILNVCVLHSHVCSPFLDVSLIDLLPSRESWFVRIVRIDLFTFFSPVGVIVVWRIFKGSSHEMQNSSIFTLIMLNLHTNSVWCEMGLETTQE